MVAHLVRAEAGNERQTPRLVIRVQNIDELQQLIGLQRRAAFQVRWDSGCRGNIPHGVVGLARAVADPEHMAGGRIPVAGGGIDARQRFLIAKQQRLMLVKKSVVRISGLVSGSMPMARMNSSVSVMRSDRAL